MTAISTLAGVLCYLLRGETALLAGLDMARSQFLDVAIQLLLGLLIAASISVLLPGAPLAVFPIVAALSQAGAGQP